MFIKKIFDCIQGIMAKVLDCSHKISKFKFQLHYYIHFQTNTLRKSFICLCLLPVWTWHKVNDPKVGLKWGLGEGKVGHKPRLEPRWTLLVISSLSTMWDWLKFKLDNKVQCYTCWSVAVARPPSQKAWTRLVPL